jgi:hypothetical protein
MGYLHGSALGRQWYRSRPVPGITDECGAFNATLSAEDIQELFA